MPDRRATCGPNFETSLLTALRSACSNQPPKITWRGDTAPGLKGQAAQLLLQLHGLGCVDGLEVTRDLSKRVTIEFGGYYFSSSCPFPSSSSPTKGPSELTQGPLLTQDIQFILLTAKAQRSGLLASPGHDT